MFGRLGDPNGANNALSQVLYGLALRSVSRPSTPFPTIDAPNRHGWGCAQNEARAVQYLSLAAGNSADVEEQALAAGIKKGGAAKGELSLALFELANCFRHGWGVAKDASAARQYYETAANMGDLEAMNEVAWCYLEGFGCKKDKVRARFSHRPGVWRSVFQNVVERRGPSARGLRRGVMDALVGATVGLSSTFSRRPRATRTGLTCARHSSRPRNTCALRKKGGATRSATHGTSVPFNHSPPSASGTRRTRFGCRVIGRRRANRFPRLFRIRRKHRASEGITKREKKSTRLGAAGRVYQDGAPRGASVAEKARSRTAPARSPTKELYSLTLLSGGPGPGHQSGKGQRQCQRVGANPPPNRPTAPIPRPRLSSAPAPPPSLLPPSSDPCPAAD
jgi:hypothetical protein